MESDLKQAQQNLRTAQKKVAAAQEEKFKSYIAGYVSKAVNEFVRFQDLDERQKLLARLEHLAKEQPEFNPLNLSVRPQRYIDLEQAKSLSDVLYQTIFYKSQGQTDQQLADWMHRSRPTACRIKALAKKVYQNQVSVDVLDKLDLK